EELCDRVAFINDGRLVVTDSPRNLKLKYGERSAKIEYLKNGSLRSEILFLDREEDKKKFNWILDKENIQTIHSREATLEQIFIRLTGRELA
ncbi:MAG: ABC transporter ATP-binding protein, partial [Actinobacteria bacterium]|nr:ABC transporter ATP-binding protein [Actinomycetota bacterium]